jgi:hypothetical protein
MSEDWANKTYAERYIGSTSYIDEYVGNDAAKLSIEFVEPESLGFNTTAWPEQGIETIVIGKVLIGSKYLYFVVLYETKNSLLTISPDYSTTEFDDVSYLMHQVRRMPNGYRELRSRFFIAKNNKGTDQLGHDLAVHCNIEMTRE